MGVVNITISRRARTPLPIVCRRRRKFVFGDSNAELIAAVFLVLMCLWHSAQTVIIVALSFRLSSCGAIFVANAQNEWSPPRAEKNHTATRNKTAVCMALIVAHDARAHAVAAAWSALAECR